MTVLIEAGCQQRSYTQTLSKQAHNLPPSLNTSYCYAHEDCVFSIELWLLTPLFVNNPTGFCILMQHCTK